MDIMVDTSIWVDFFNDVENPQVRYLDKLLQEGRAGRHLPGDSYGATSRYSGR